MTLGRFTRWFELTREEQFWVAGILAIFLIGLVARWHHVSREPADAPPASPIAGEDPRGSTP